MDLLSRRVTRGSRTITLQPREFKLLEYLMRHANQVVTRTMLLEAVWDYNFDPQTNVVDVHISKLRRRSSSDSEPPLLRTVRNAGYMMSQRRPRRRAMNRLMRSTALTWAFGYVLLGIGTLAAFAVPLWYAWNVTIFAGREEILRDDVQRLTEVFERDGIGALTAHINARVGLQIAGERTLLLTDSAYQPARRQPVELAAGHSRLERHARSDGGSGRSAGPYAAGAEHAPRRLPPAGRPRPVALPAARAPLHLGADRGGHLPVRGGRRRGAAHTPRAAGARPGHRPDGIGDHAGRPAAPPAGRRLGR